MIPHLQIVKDILLSRVIVRNLILFVVIGAMASSRWPNTTSLLTAVIAMA
jgi:hypothetical protein